MLADGRTIGAPFYAPRYWLELWDLGNRRVAFGGFEALLRPMVDQDRAKDVRDHCSPTRALIAAVGNMRVVGGRNGFWTDHWSLTLDGWRGYDLDGAPPSGVVAAIEGAFPMPTTFQEAHDEYAYWAWRAYGIGTVVAFEDGEGTDALAALLAPELDLVSQVRAERVRRLLVSDEVTPSIEGVETKLRMYLFVEGRDFALEASVMRDLSHLRQALTRPVSVHAQQPVIIRKIVEAPLAVAVPNVPAPRTAKAPRVSGVQNPEVTAELLRIPRPSDRAIAQRVGVSPTTVGAERERLIAAGRIDPRAPAFVTRCNVLGTYQMKARRGGIQATADGKSMKRSAAADTVTMKEPPPLSSTGGTAREQRVAPVPRGNGERSSRLLKGEQLKFPWER